MTTDDLDGLLESAAHEYAAKHFDEVCARLEEEKAGAKFLAAECDALRARVAELERRKAFFWERCEKRGPTECWPWRGNINAATGYGQCSFGSKGSEERWRAHRLAFELFSGPIPAGLVVMHSCDNRACVNPAHLSLGTVADNNADMMRKGRHVAPSSLLTSCRRGHEFVPGSFRTDRNGVRHCHECRRIWEAAHSEQLLAKRRLRTARDRERRQAKRFALKEKVAP